jgi:iron-sulfur cluster repair protein YtfE (RIC family)
MESILEELFRQHRDAEGMLVKLAAGVKRVEREGAKAAGVIDDLRDLRRAIQGEVLSHFREEEQALFPVLGMHIDSASGPIAMLMEEHAIFRQLELQLEEAVAALEAGFRDGWEEKFCDAAYSIARLLPAHIDKEESVLFPMAEGVLSADEWDDVRRLWNEAMAAGPPA